GAPCGGLRGNRVQIPSGPATVTGIDGDRGHCAAAWEGRGHEPAGSQETCLRQGDVHAFGSKAGMETPAAPCLLAARAAAAEAFLYLPRAGRFFVAACLRACASTPKTRSREAGVRGSSRASRGRTAGP